MKFCPGCKTEKPFTEFSRNKRRHDGLTNYCKSCWKRISREQYLKNRDKLAARYREKRATMGRQPRNQSERITCVVCGLWFRAAPGRQTTCLPCRNGRSIEHGTRTTYGRGCRCRPCTSAASTEAVQNRRRRLKRLGLPDDNRHRTRARRYGGRYEVVDREQVFVRDGWICGICTKPVDPVIEWPDPQSASLDHKTPLRLGGDHTYENVQCAHLRCNQSKQHRVIAHEPSLTL